MSKSRIELREHSSIVINELTREELLQEFSISRVADITGLDVIGLPVYTTSRVLSATIATHAGKGLDPLLARSGAIAEAIEFEVAEKPTGDLIYGPASHITPSDRLDLADCFPTRSSIVNDSTPLAWEEVTNVQNGETKLIPSDLIWMVPRSKDQVFMYLQMGSNGLASGASLEDAILSGLYEILERDAWTLHQYCLDTIGMMPARVPLTNLPDYLETIVRRIESQQLRLHLFDCTNDYRIPTFCAMLLDLSGNCAGTFAGYGAHLDARIAATRAITEAAQGRAGYISGARDDMLRRQFLIMKRTDQMKLDSMFTEVSKMGPALAEYRQIEFPTVKAELRYLLKLIKGRGVNQVFVKEMGSYLDGTIYVVRVFSPQCEPYKFDHWSPSLRCVSYAERKFKEMKGKENPSATNRRIAET